MNGVGDMSEAMPWVLLRGLTRERRHWGTFPQTFAAALPGAPVIALDLPGNGALHLEPSPWLVEAMAGHCRRQLQGLGVPPPYRVLAMSLGAMVATSWAASHPEEISAAVLINTSMRPFSPFHHRLRQRNYAWLLRLMLMHPSDHDREQAVLRLTSGAPQRHPGVVDAWAAYRRECPVTRSNAWRQLVAAALWSTPRKRPAVPLLLLTSAADGLVDTRCSWRLAQHWQCAIATHPWAGHDLPLDDGPWVAAQVRDWLARASGGVPCEQVAPYSPPANRAPGPHL